MHSQNLFTRDDTFFGVCEGLGQDLGINSNLLRIAFSLSLLWNPVVTIMTYVAAGAFVAVSRRFYPAAVEKTEQSATAQPLTSDNDDHAHDYAHAA